MPTATWNKFQDFSEQLVRGVHDFDANTFKVALASAAPNATDTQLSQITTQLSTGGGYTSGGETITTIGVSESGGTTTVTGTQLQWTGSGSGFGPFRYAVLYNDSATSPPDALIAWFDYGSAISVAASETFTLKFNNASPGTMFTLV